MNARKRLKSTLTWMVFLVSCGITPTIPGGGAEAQSPCINPQMEIDQEKLIHGEYSFRKVVESGRHLFVYPFITDEGYG